MWIGDNITTSARVDINVQVAAYDIKFLHAWERKKNASTKVKVSVQFLQLSFPPCHTAWHVINNTIYPFHFKNPF